MGHPDLQVERELPLIGPADHGGGRRVAGHRELAAAEGRRHGESHTRPAVAFEIGLAHTGGPWGRVQHVVLALRELYTNRPEQAGRSSGEADRDARHLGDLHPAGCLLDSPEAIPANDERQQPGVRPGVQRADHRKISNATNGLPTRPETDDLLGLLSVRGQGDRHQHDGHDNLTHTLTSNLHVRSL